MDLSTSDTSGQPRGGPEDPRTRFAAERTLLAWVRTGLALMGFGFVVARFGLFLREIALSREETPARSYGLSLWIGTALVGLGIAVTLAAAAEHRRVIGRLTRREEYEPPRWSLGLVVAVALAVLGGAMVAYLLLLGR